MGLNAGNRSRINTETRLSSRDFSVAVLPKPKPMPPCLIVALFGDVLLSYSSAG